MVACLACGTENSPGRKFCGGCGAGLQAACPSCGAPNEPGMRFCGDCGTALGGAEPPDVPAAAGRASERRLVSVLFADLVGFTSISESRDAEAVRELLARYFDTCRRLIELYGGTVEKFIGDAVMAVWGAPVAQEDDAERAVRAALDLVDAVAQLGEAVETPDLRLRAGVLTGEAAVTLGAAGQGMVAGDLVNTASRIQSTADPGTVLVGEATKRATDAAIAYEPAGSHTLKGKADDVPLWRALRVTAQRGGVRKSAALEPPFVGRDRELRVVKELFHATADERAARLLTVIGIAGIGKSRLAWEFEKFADGVLDAVWWHRGRCLSYGDGVAYWALAEMIRMRARIAEEAGPDLARAQLAEMLVETIPVDAEREWIEPRLAHLLGLGEPLATDRQDLFSAWRLFFERLAERAPVVLVFEDLQWADASLLDFLEHLLDWSRAYPIYVLALARPELAERRAGWGSGGRAATVLPLEPLQPRAMGELLDGFVPGLPVELRAQIQERAEGIPLYAVETVRMLLDRGLLEREGDAFRVTGTVEALEVPETLHALVAARLDGLGADERAVLQDAAVLGKSFTRAGVAEVSGRSEAEVETILTALIRKEVLTVQADPTSPERGQYGFLQDILKRVAYDTLGRIDRKARHLAAARHLEQAWGASEQEIVEVVAAHYLDAYEAEPEAADAASIKAQAAEMLARAGERATSLAASEEAQHYFEKAAGLVDDPLRRAALLDDAGSAARLGRRYQAALALYERSIELYSSEGAANRIAHVAASLGRTMWFAGDIRGGVERLEQAFAVLADDEPDAAIAELAESLARLRFFLGDLEASRERVERALEIAEALVLPGVLVDALNTKHLLLDVAGRSEEALALIQRAIAIGREHRLGEALTRALYNYSFELVARDEFAEAKRTDLEGLEIARRRGDDDEVARFKGHLAGDCFFLGEWDEAIAHIDATETAEAARDAMDRMLIVPFLAVQRGDVATARAVVDLFAPFADDGEVQVRVAFSIVLALVLRAEGRSLEALDHLAEGLAAGDALSVRHPFLKDAWRQSVEASFEVGDLERAVELLGVSDRLPPVDRTPQVQAHSARFRARLHAVGGETAEVEPLFERAAELFGRIAMPFELGIVQLEHAEWLVGEGRPGEAEPLLAEAQETFARLGASPWLERVAAARAARV